MWEWSREDNVRMFSISKSWIWNKMTVHCIYPSVTNIWIYLYHFRYKYSLVSYSYLYEYIWILIRIIIYLDIRSYRNHTLSVTNICKFYFHLYRYLYWFFCMNIFRYSFVRTVCNKTSVFERRISIMRRRGVTMQWPVLPSSWLPPPANHLCPRLTPLRSDLRQSCF